MKRRNTIWFFAMIVFIIPVSAFALLNWYEKKWHPLPVLINKHHRIAPFDLINQDGKAYNRDQWNNKIIIVDFFFTHCPTICPKMTQNMKRVQDVFSNEGNLILASFSVDPGGDSPA